MIRTPEYLANAAQGGDKDSNSSGLDLLNGAGCQVGELGEFLLGQAGGLARCAEIVPDLL